MKTPLGQAVCRPSRRASLAVALGVAALVALLPPLPAHAADPAQQQFLFAYKLLQRGDQRLAAEAFDQYLGDFPRGERRGDAAYYRALLHRRAGELQQAAAILDDAPQPTLVPDHAVQLLAGQVLSDLRQHDRALTHLEAIDASALSDRAAASTRFLRGLTYRATGNLAAAAADLEAAAELDTPLRPRCRLEIARVRVLQDRHADARELLDTLLQSDSRSVEAEAARLAGELAYRDHDYDDAVAHYGRVIARHQSSPHFGPAVVGTMWAHLAADRPRRVLELFDRHADALPLQDRLPATYLKGSAHLRLDQPDAAAEALAGIARGEGRYPLLDQVLYKLAVARRDLGEHDAARDAIARLSTLYPRSPLLADAAFLLAVIDAEAGNVDRGAARLTELIEQGPDHPYHDQALLRRGRLYERHGRPGLAIEDYQAFLAEAGLDGEQGPAVALRLADLALAQNRPRLAADVTAAVLDRRDRLDAEAAQEAMFRRALSLIRLDRPDAATAQLDQLEQAFPVSRYAPQVRYYRGLLAARQGQPQQAIPALRDAADHDGLSTAQRVNSLRLLAMLQRDADPAASADAIERMIELGGVQAVEPAERLWLARRRLGANRPEAALELVNPVVGSADPGAVLAEALLLRGRALRQLQRYDQAEEALAHVQALGEGFDLEAQAERARVLADRGRHAAAIDALVPLTQSRSSRVAAEALYDTAANHRALARGALRTDDTASAADHLDDAAGQLKRLVILYPFQELSPLPQRAYLDLAEVELARGRTAAAERELSELIDKFPDSPHAAVARAWRAELNPPFGEGLAALRRADRGGYDEHLSDRVDRLIERWEAPR